MINRMTVGVKAALTAFCTANYSTASDGLNSIPTYLYEEFDPTDKETYTKLLANANVSAVIWNVECTNDFSNSPTGYIRILYTCKLTIVAKSANQWDTANRLNRVQQGSASNPAKNSLHNFLINFMGYFHQNKLNDGSGVVSFIQNITDIEQPVFVGDFISFTANIEAKHMFSTTISVTPV